jgi:hypothetical protein
MDDGPQDLIDHRDALTAWPTCPQCGQGRHTACHFCGAAGTDFPQVEPALTPDDESDPPRLWILCPLCDELLAAQFFRRCEWCGHDFGEGLENDSPSYAQQREELMTVRAILVAAMLVAGLLIASIYFALLTSG